MDLARDLLDQHPGRDHRAVLIWISCPRTSRTREKLDYRGTALITGAMGLIVLGFEQSSVWGWSSPATWVCIDRRRAADGRVRPRTSCASDPLLRLEIFRDRGFATDTVVLGLMSIVFVPFFFFGSVYAQVSLGKNSSQAGEYILCFFIGFVIAAQIGGRMLDRRGARPSVVIGGALGAVGFYLLAGKLTDLSLGAQWLYIAIAGGGPRADARPGQHRRGQPRAEHELQRGHRDHPDRAQLRREPRARGPRRDPDQPERDERHQRADQARRPERVAHRVAASFSTSGAASGSGSGTSPALVHDVQLAFAHSTQTVFYIMAGVMVATFFVAVRWLPRGRLESVDDEEEFVRRRTGAGNCDPVSGDQLVTKLGPLSVEDTVARFSDVLSEKGVKLFAVIDHSGEAEKAGLELRDTKVVIFGAPKAGTPVMQAVPAAALDLPLKVLVWDDEGQTKLTYLAPAALATRYGLSDELAARLAAIDPLTDAVIAG